MTESLRDIRLFVAAYEERSFTAAAERERATQSGVSQHIRKLEERFGVPLFTREKGRVTPTPAADAYYARCLELLRAHEDAAATMRGFVGGLSGEISVGLMPTMTRSALAPSLARFVAAHPNVSLHIIEAYSGVLTQQVRAGELDFAIVPAFAGVPGIKVRPFLRTPETLVSTRDGPYRHLAPVRLGELGPLKIVLPGVANTRRLTLDTYFASNGVKIERTMELDAMMGTLDYVANSEWVTVLPGVMMASDVERHTLTVNPLAAPPLALDLVAIEPARKAMAAPAQAFFAIVQQETERLNQAWDVTPPSPRPSRGEG